MGKRVTVQRGDKRGAADGNRADRVLDKGVEFIHVIHSVVIFFLDES
jgi:hypothetical protein